MASPILEERLLSRATFGPRPGDREVMAEQGPEAWLSAELGPKPTAGDDSSPKRLQRFPSLGKSASELLADTALEASPMMAPRRREKPSKEQRQEIRQLSRAAGLPTAELPASACLSSRLPYGREVTPERLAAVEAGEAALHALGFRQVRVRHHGPLARVEIAPEEMQRALEPEMARRIGEAVKPAGFRWVALDLDGYRSGALNEVLGEAAGPMGTPRA